MASVDERTLLWYLHNKALLSTLKEVNKLRETEGEISEDEFVGMATDEFMNLVEQFFFLPDPISLPSLDPEEGE